MRSIDCRYSIVRNCQQTFKITILYRVDIPKPCFFIASSILKPGFLESLLMSSLVWLVILVVLLGVAIFALINVSHRKELTQKKVNALKVDEMRKWLLLLFGERTSMKDLMWMKWGNGCCCSLEKELQWRI